MRIVFAMLYYDEVQAARGPARYLEAMPLHRALGAELVRAGHEVEVVFHFPVDGVLDDEGVRFRFVAPGPVGRAWGSVAKRLGRERAYYEPAVRAIDAIAGAGAEIVHFHGTIMHLNLALLAARLQSEALVVQHHGGGPARNPVTRALQRRGFARAGRLVFTSAAQAGPFIAAGLLDGNTKVEAAIEVSTLLRAPPRDEARRQSGLVGDPIFVSAGRLHPEKDPLTMLRGFEIIAKRWPGSRLYLVYLTDELLPALRRYVDARATLAGRVQFLGRVPHAEMAAILGSADFLLQASLREVAGYAILEAMAAGVIPVVTRIDSFEAITDGGRQGLLFARRDPEALARCVLALDPETLPARRAALHAHFEAHLSFAALARRFEAIYSRLLVEHRR
jgi:glycosyltransferase involved in cell wall biosynthesis